LLGRVVYVFIFKKGKLLNQTLNSLKPGDTFIIPNQTYYLMGGIIVSNLTSVVIQIDGTIAFSDDIDNWPTNSDGHVSINQIHLKFFFLNFLTKIGF
jgi:hypothetical protein